MEIPFPAGLAEHILFFEGTELRMMDERTQAISYVEVVYPDDYEWERYQILPRDKVVPSKLVPGRLTVIHPHRDETLLLQFDLNPETSQLILAGSPVVLEDLEE